MGERMDCPKCDADISDTYEPDDRKRTLRIDIDKDWCIRMAIIEGDGVSISAGGETPAMLIKCSRCGKYATNAMVCEIDGCPIGDLQ